MPNHLLYSLMICFIIPISAFAQTSQPPALDRVLTLTGEKEGVKDLPQDHGIAGIWQKLLKLQTTASMLHTVAHPDDEHADLLTYLSRGKGVRTALLSLNRGEGGANVLGGELFDALGLLRTQEFLLAASYYGLDDLYFTDVADYGFSKRVEEAYQKWDKQHVLAQMVRVIRITRPLVIISRFHGSERDGHGNHQAAGEITQEAYRLAGNPNAFPEQITKEGLRPWKPLKLYRGGVKPDEPWNVAPDTGEYSSWLGDSYKNFALLGYSFHRSQFSGVRFRVNGPSRQYYECLHSHAKSSSEKEKSPFDGMDTSVEGIFTITGEIPPAGISRLLKNISAAIKQAIADFGPQNPAAIIPHLTKALSQTRSAIELLNKQPEARFLLQIKEKQLVDAIHTALGIRLQALAMQKEAKMPANFYQSPPAMGVAVPGQPFKVDANLLNPSSVRITSQHIRLIAPQEWKIDSDGQTQKTLQMNEKLDEVFMVTVPENSPFSQPYFHRHTMQESRYQVDDHRFAHLPQRPTVLSVAALYTVNDVAIEFRKPVQVLQANLPYGYDTHSLQVAPAIAVAIRPGMGVIPKDSKAKSITLQVELQNNFDGAIQGELQLKTPAGWQVQPSQTPFSFTKPGEKNNFLYTVSVPEAGEQTYDIQAIATVNGKSFTQGYDLISHRDLDPVYLYRPAVASIKGIDVKTEPDLQIGYIMGAGDEIPLALQQLDASVQLLTVNELSRTKLSQFHAIMVGTRAYAVRQDLHTYNQRLLDYVKEGGHLIVLYQTPEFIPDRMAPYPAQLPANAEEVSEEDSPVKILTPDHQVLRFPNQITGADFEGWIEQRGSKFFSQWNAAYIPILSTQDQGQLPQSGGWLMAKYGKGNYTYCAYALHRQLPYGVAGAYRILANLVSLGKIKPGDRMK